MLPLSKHEILIVLTVLPYMIKKIISRILPL